MRLEQGLADLLRLWDHRGAGDGRLELGRLPPFRREDLVHVLGQRVGQCGPLAHAGQDHAQ